MTPEIPGHHRLETRRKHVVAQHHRDTDAVTGGTILRMCARQNTVPNVE
jgi:hypothetical protein